VNQKEQPLTRSHWMVLIAAFLGWMFDGLEMGLFPIAGRPALRDIMATISPGGELAFPTETAVGQWYSYLVALFLLGAATGGLLFGWLGDRMGRVRTMALSITAYSLFTGCCYFAAQPWQLGVFRFCAALGMGGEWSLGVALIMECWPERLRPLLAGVIGAAANFGFLAIALLGMFFAATEDSWRWFMLAGAVPGVLAVFIMLFIPESQRWKESIKTAVSKPIREIFTTSLVWPTLLAICFASIPLIATWGGVSGFLPVWTDKLVGERELKVDMKIADPAPPHFDTSVDKVQITHSGAAGVSPGSGDARGAVCVAERVVHFERPPRAGQPFLYRLRVTNQGDRVATGVTVEDELPMDQIDPASVSIRESQDATFDRSTGVITWNVGNLEFKSRYAKGTVQVVISIGAIIGCIAGPLIGGVIGRRPAYFGLCLTSLVICQILFREGWQYGALFLLVSAVAGCLTAAFYGWLPLYLPELFPTRVRATGQGLSFNFGRIFAAMGALTTGQIMGLFEGSYPVACSTITLVYVFGLILIWFAPETKGKPLPQ
jgi:SHS family sialic acid transporter-like MFS transporter